MRGRGMKILYLIFVLSTILCICAPENVNKNNFEDEKNNEDGAHSETNDGHHTEMDPSLPENDVDKEVDTITDLISGLNDVEEALTAFDNVAKENDEKVAKPRSGLINLDSKIKFKVITSDGKEINEMFFGGNSQDNHLIESSEDDLSSDDLDEADDDFDLLRNFANIDLDHLPQKILQLYFLDTKDDSMTTQTLETGNDSPNKLRKNEDLGQSGHFQVENEDDGEEDDKLLSILQRLRTNFKEAQELYSKAQIILKKRTVGIGTPEPAYQKAFDYLKQSSEYKFIPALEEIGYAHLFGRGVRQNLTQARSIFEELASKGSPRAQMGLGFLHATGLIGPRSPSSQSKALVYYTFASLGGDPFAQMALGYRYKYGVSVTENCESSLTNYRRVAKRVAKEVRDSRAVDNPGVIQRIRILDVVDPPQTPPPTVSSDTTSPSATHNSEGTGSDSESSSQRETSSSASSSNTVSVVLDKDLIKYYKFLADKGDTQAQIGLGQLLYQGGRGVAPDPREAYNLFYRAATESNNPYAQAFLGKMYVEGIGDDSFLKPNNQTAFDYYTKSAKQGNPMGQTGLGIMYLYGFTFNDTLHGEDDNTKSAINNRGQSTAKKLIHDSDEGIEDLVKKAQEHETQSNERRGLNAFKKHQDPIKVKGNEDTESTKFVHVASDPEKAFNYFKLAADQGYPEAQLFIGNMYFTGTGVIPNYRVALKYYNYASQSGNLLAFYNLAQMHAIGLGALRSCFTSMELFKNVAERGYWGRMLMEAFHAYQDGRFDSALVIYLFLAELGYEAGQSNAAYLLENEPNRLFPKNESIARAFVLWKKSALQGYNGARIKLGDYYYYGYGNNDGSADYEAAAHNYRTAYENQKSARALFNLAYMHERGYGLKKDLHLAKRYYDMAFQASPDAHVPVTLALTKLQILLYLEQMRQLDLIAIRKLLINLQKVYIPDDWDLYLIMIAAFLLGSLIYVRRRPFLPVP